MPQRLPAGLLAKDPDSGDCRPRGLLFLYDRRARHATQRRDGDAVPEPSTLPLFALALVVCVVSLRIRARGGTKIG